MSIMKDIVTQNIRGRLVADYRVASKWLSVRFVTGGALFSAVAFAISLSSAGMQFLGVFGVRITLAIVAIIFLCALIGRIWRQHDLPPSNDNG